MKEKLERLRFYLDYIEEHYNNVITAWKLIQEKCSDLDFIKDARLRKRIDDEVKDHDLSKLSAQELVQYQEKFYPTEAEKTKKGVRPRFKEAFAHHKKENLHHVEAWRDADFKDPREWVVHCVHMIADWHAMGTKFGDDAFQFFRKTKPKGLDEEALILIDQIFDRIYGKRILSENF